MRLAWLSTDPGIAFGGSKGASVHLAELVSAVAAQGTEILLLVHAVQRDALAPERVVVEALPDAERGELAGWLVRRLERFAPVALYERIALDSDTGSRAARAVGIPHLVELNAPLPEEAARYRSLVDPVRAIARERDVLRFADFVFAVSPPLAERARALGAGRVEVLQNAADLDRFRPPSRRAARPIAAFAGSLRPWHGIETIATAWRLLGPSAPPLLVIGDGPARTMLEGIPARFVGSVPPVRVPALLAEAEIGLAPYGPDSPHYFSPLKLFEYLAAGLATIIADLPAVTAVVDEDSAVIIPAGDARELAKAVARLAGDPVERHRLGDGGRRLVASAHTWRHRADRILGAIAEVSAAPVSA